MTDYTEMLDAVKIPLRETSTTLIDDTDILKFYNEGGRQFADMTACIRDTWLTPIVPATGPPAGVLTYQFIPDAANVFSKVTVSASLSRYRYKVAKALWFDSIQVVGATQRSNDGVLNRIGVKAIATEGYLDPTRTSEYPDHFRAFFAAEFELWPIFTETAFSLLIEGRRRWVEMAASTQEVCYLPDRFKPAPMFYARYLAGLAKRDYDFARENFGAYGSLVQQALAEIEKEDMAGGLTRRIVTP